MLAALSFDDFVRINVWSGRGLGVLQNEPMKPLIQSFALLFVSIIAGQAAHPFLCCDYGGNKVCVVSAEGQITWKYECKNPQDCWKLPNGNYLFCFLNGALEVTPDKQTVWEYKAPEKVEVHACQPLPNGRVMVVEGGSSRIIEVGRDGKVAKEIKLSTTVPQMHNQFRGTRKTKEGHYLVCFKGEGKIVELDGEGKVLREIKVPGDPHEEVESDRRRRQVHELQSVHVGQSRRARRQRVRRLFRADAQAWV